MATSLHSDAFCYEKTAGRKKLELEFEQSASERGVHHYIYYFYHHARALQQHSVILISDLEAGQDHIQSAEHQDAADAIQGAARPDALFAGLLKRPLSSGDSGQAIYTGNASLGTTEFYLKDGRALSVLRFENKETGPSVSQHENSLMSEVKSLVREFHHKLTGLIMGLDESDDDFIITDREKEVYIWTAIGKTCNEIAVILNISKRTVDFHISNVISKLGVRTKIQACIQLTKMGIL